jgi:uncharacterized membrane-anchored protein
MLKRLATVLALALVLAASAQADEEPSMTAEQFEGSLTFQKGAITLPGGMATLNVPDSFRYLNPGDAERVLVEAWGNPSGEGTLGMLFPADVSPVDEDSWGVVITYEEDGYVSDKDADAIDYDDLLKDMKAAVAERNKERQEQGYQAIDLVGWAAKPRYDRPSHKLYWAKELSFAADREHTLNYNIRVLGRRGVLVLNAVSSMHQMENVAKQMQTVLAFTDFNPGFRYADYDAKTDKKAAYGIAALVAGGVAAKAGLFTKLLGILLAAKKAVIVGLVALGAAVLRLFKKKKSQGAPENG